MTVRGEVHCELKHRVTYSRLIKFGIWMDILMCSSSIQQLLTENEPVLCKSSHHMSIVYKSCTHTQDYLVVGCHDALKL